VTKSFNINALKRRSLKFGRVWQKKMRYLSDTFSRSGMEGVTHWLKSHHQIEELKSAIEELLMASQDESFVLLQVETTLNSFILPGEDRGQLEWYKTAHNYLLDFENKLLENNCFDLKKLQLALNELKFISQSNEFHTQYCLQPIQQKVTKVYHDLQQAIVDYKAIEKEKLHLKKEQDELKVAQFETEKAQAIAKKAMIENIKIKEKRIAIIEEKKRMQTKKELLDAQNKQQRERAEQQVKQAEFERQEKLQEAYIDLQLEEIISHWSIEDFVRKFTKKLAENSLDEEQKQMLNDFVSVINSKK